MMMRDRMILPALSAAAPALVLTLILAMAVACGGGHSSPQPQASTTTSTTTSVAAQGLAYTDPTSTGWRLVKDAASTDTRLVLNLVGPSGLLSRGVGFNLQVPATVKVGTFGNHLPISDLGVYDLLSSVNDPNEAVALGGGLKAGNLLSVGLYQKGRDKSAKDSGAPLCQIALTFDATAGLHAGDAIPLSVVKARIIPEDIGPEAADPTTMRNKYLMTDISIALGALTAK
jgi:hypothetical protein